MSFPLGTDDVLTYIGYLLEDRKVAGSTIEKYLTGLRYLRVKDQPGLINNRMYTGLCISKEDIQYLLYDQILFSLCYREQNKRMP